MTILLLFISRRDNRKSNLRRHHYYVLFFLVSIFFVGGIFSFGSTVDCTYCTVLHYRSYTYDSHTFQRCIQSKSKRIESILNDVVFSWIGKRQILKVRYVC